MPDGNNGNFTSPLEMTPDQFRKIGHQLVDEIAGFLTDLPNLPVTRGEEPGELNALLEERVWTEEGVDADQLVQQSARFIFDHSLFNAHPRFWGYITSSAAPLGALADLLAAAVNPNVGAFILSPAATTIERQAIRWIAEIIGYPSHCGGLFVSGGNMANFAGFVAARQAKYRVTEQTKGFTDKLHIVYCALGTHTWIDKAIELFGDGPKAIKWIETNDHGQLDCEKLKKQIDEDLQNGSLPFMVIGNAGSVTSGVVDQLSVIASIAKTYQLWFHVDGAYGAPAALLPELAPLFEGLSAADSVALDPHKWLYGPLEAGCIMVKESHHLRNAFSHVPDYYNFNHQGTDEVVNFFEYGMQNSRGFRALKVWMMLQAAGKNGYKEMIRNDIALADYLFELADASNELEAVSKHLSITVFRFLPSASAEDEKYINTLNEELLNTLQESGQVFVSNAVIHGKYCLRACFVNFRSRKKDVEFLISTVLSEGRKIHVRLQQPA